MPTTPSVGFTGKGGSVTYATTSTGTYSKIAQVQKVSFSGSKSNLADITNLDSPSAFIERIPTTIDAGTMSLNIVSDPMDAGQLGIQAAFNAQTLLYIKVQYPPVLTQVTGLLKTFTAYVTSSPSPDMAVTQAATFDSIFTITGPITDVAGS